MWNEWPDKASAPHCKTCKRRLMLKFRGLQSSRLNHCRRSFCSKIKRMFSVCVAARGQTIQWMLDINVTIVGLIWTFRILLLSHCWEVNVGWTWSHDGTPNYVSTVMTFLPVNIVSGSLLLYFIYVLSLRFNGSGHSNGEVYVLAEFDAEKYTACVCPLLWLLELLNAPSKLRLTAILGGRSCTCHEFWWWKLIWLMAINTFCKTETLVSFKDSDNLHGMRLLSAHLCLIMSSHSSGRHYQQI